MYHLLTFMARGPTGPAFHCHSAQLWRAARAGQLIIAFLCNLPPLWRAARPGSERSVGSPVIICLLFHLPTFMARGPSGPAFHCLSAQFSPRYGARPERASLSLPYAQFAPVMARGPSSEGALRRRPSYHLPCVSFEREREKREERERERERKE